MPKQLSPEEIIDLSNTELAEYYANSSIGWDHPWYASRHCKAEIDRRLRESSAVWWEMFQRTWETSNDAQRLDGKSNFIDATLTLLEPGREEEREEPPSDLLP